MRCGHYSSFAKRFGHFWALIVPVPAPKAVGTLPVTSGKQGSLVCPVSLSEQKAGHAVTNAEM